MTTADRVADHELLMHESSGPASVHRFRLPADAPVAAAEVRALVSDGFANLNLLLGSREDMTDDEFAADWADGATWKFLATRAGHPVGYMTVLVGLDRMTWAPHTQVEAYQQAAGLEGPPLYVGTLVVKSSASKAGVGQALLLGAFKSLADWNEGSADKSAVYFDCAGPNAVTIPRYVAVAARSAPGAFAVHQAGSLQDGPVERLTFAAHS